MSIKKVADIAGVSIATVSRYFNNPDKVSQNTKEKVQGAISKINYSPNSLAQNLRRGKTGLIIAVIPKISSSLYEPVTKQLTQLASEEGYNLLVKQAPFNSLPLDYFKNMIRCKQADGFIILTGLATKAQQEHLAEIEPGLPIVLAGEPCAFGMKMGLPHLSIDYHKAAQDATNYLITQNHKAIAFIARNYHSHGVQHQQSGFFKAMAAAQLKSKAYMIQPDNHQLDLKEKLDLVMSFDPRPSAIYCADDDAAIELMHWIKLKNLKIPDDISILGFNNTYFSQLCDPPLSTIDNPMGEIGEKAMHLLLQLIGEESVKANSTLFDYKVVIRDSVKPKNR